MIPHSRSKCLAIPLLYQRLLWRFSLAASIAPSRTFCTERLIICHVKLWDYARHMHMHYVLEIEKESTQGMHFENNQILTKGVYTSTTDAMIFWHRSKD